MIETEKGRIHYLAEREILRKAVEGDQVSVNEALLYLSSVNPDLRHVMQAAIHEMNDAWVWRHLIRCLAVHRWNNNVDCKRRADPEASERIDNAIVEVLTSDTCEQETTLKREILAEGLQDADHRVRHSAAYLLAIRNDPQAIPYLNEALNCNDLAWQLRAVEALGKVKDERAGWPLVKALAMDRGPLHKAARKAISRLGLLAAPALVEALSHPDGHIRWHAARSLGEAGDPRAVHLLAEGLYDEVYNVRWATSDVLSKLGEPAVLAVLELLSQRPPDEPARQAIYHALHGLVSAELRARLAPLLEALHGPAADLEAPLVAQRLYYEFKGETHAPNLETFIEYSAGY